MNLASTAVSSLSQVRRGISSRQGLQAIQRLSAGRKQGSGDLGAATVAGLDVRTRTERVAVDALDKALVLAQYQLSGLQTADAIVNRMDDLAYRATDPLLNARERSDYDYEFKALSKSLVNLLTHQQFDQPVFDPMASKHVDAISVGLPPSGNADEKIKKQPIDAYRGTVKLWWKPHSYRDRIQMYQGSSLFFDSGEYQSTDPSNNTRPAELVVRPDGSEELLSGDYFEVDFGKNEVELREAADNTGNASYYDKTNPYEAGTSANGQIHPGVYPRVQVPKGDSSIINFVVNNTDYPAENNWSVTRDPNTGWTYWIDVVRTAILGPEALSSSEGDQYQLQTKGFTDLSNFNLADMASAAEAMEMTAREKDNLGYQMSKFAADFSYLSLRRDYLADKTSFGSIAIGRIRDVDVAAESIKLARSRVLDSATDHALIHSRLATKNILDLLF